VYRYHCDRRPTVPAFPSKNKNIFKKLKELK